MPATSQRTTSPDDSRTTAQPGASWRHAAGAAVAASAILVLVLLAFAGPTYTAKTKEIPIAVAGAQPAVAAFEQQLAAQGEASAAIDVRELSDRAAAVTAIEQREVYGAIVLPNQPGGVVEVMTASAGSAPATQLLNRPRTGHQQGGRGAWLTLAAWLVVGVALIIVGHHRNDPGALEHVDTSPGDDSATRG